jgi:Caspase domain
MPRAFRKPIFSLLLLTVWCLSASHAFAEKRVALIIGNSAYDKVARLPNPANDAALIADTFKSAGFDSVDLRRDLKVGDMRRALRDFIDKSRARRREG